LYRTPFIQVGTIEERYRLRIGVTRDLYYAFWTDTAKRFNVVDLFQVKPGDGIAAKLSLERGRWSISILDAATGRRAHVATPDETRQRLNVAAWIQEDVTDGRTGRASPYPQLSSIHMRGRAGICRRAPKLCSGAGRRPMAAVGAASDYAGEHRCPHAHYSDPIGHSHARKEARRLGGGLVP
jgi:hypothetical protein